MNNDLKNAIKFTVTILVAWLLFSLGWSCQGAIPPSYQRNSFTTNVVPSSGFISNYFELGVTNLAGTTPDLDWSGPQRARWRLTDFGTLGFVNTNISTARARRIELTLEANGFTASFPGYVKPANGVPFLNQQNTGATNHFAFWWDGTNFYGKAIGSLNVGLAPFGTLPGANVQTNSASAAGVVKPAGTGFRAWATDASGNPDWLGLGLTNGVLTNVTLLNLADGEILKWHAASKNWTNAADAGAGSGEVNTGSNLGIGWPTFDSKSGVDLRFNTWTNGAGLTSASNANTLTVSVANDGISDAMLRNSGARSVLGRAANSGGDPADISANTDGEVLWQTNSGLRFGKLVLTNATFANLSLLNVADGEVLKYNASAKQWTNLTDVGAATPAGSHGQFQWNSNNVTVQGSAGLLYSNETRMVTVAPLTGVATNWVQVLSTNGTVFWAIASNATANLYGTGQGAQDYFDADASHYYRVIATNVIGTNINHYSPSEPRNGIPQWSVSDGTNLFTTVIPAALADGQVLWRSNGAAQFGKIGLTNDNLYNVNLLNQAAGQRLVAHSATVWTNGPAVTYETVWIDAGMLVTNVTLGSAFAVQEYGSPTNRMFDWQVFSDGTTNLCQASFPLPLDWDLQPVKFKFYWSSTNAIANQTNVWAVQATALAHDDPLDGDWGTEQIVKSKVTAANDLIVSDATPAVTVGNTPAAGDLISVRVKRLGGHADDAMTSGEAKLRGVWLQYGRSGATNLIQW